MDIVKVKKKKGGARPGAGRKKGYKTPATLEREAVAAAINQQIMQQAATIIRSTLIPALGTTYIYRIDREKNKKGDVISVKHVLVKDQHEIALALDQIGQPNQSGEDEYYYITTERPEFKAGESLLNRALGKAKESVEHSNPDGNLKTIIINKG